MKLIDKLNRRAGGRECRKRCLHLPNADAERLGWSRRQVFNARISGKRLVVELAGPDDG